MEPTARWWPTAGLGLSLVGLAVLLARPVLLLGGAAVGAWLLAWQYLFATEVGRVDDRLSIDTVLEPGRVTVGAPASLTIEAAVDGVTWLDLTVEQPLPVPVRTADGAAPELTIEDGSGSATVSIEGTVAGGYTFERPTVTVEEPLGLLRETLARGPTPTLTVDARPARDVHVGAGGDTLGAVIGSGDREPTPRATGIEPAGLRRYVPGDELRRIDWNATARLGDPHVREFEAGADWTTALVVDRRDTMHRPAGTPAKLDYAREIALAVVDGVGAFDDRIALYTVGDDEVSTPRSAGGSQAHYATVRHHLHRLTRDRAGRAGRPGIDRRPGWARRAADRLRDADARFATRLRPFLDTGGADVVRVTGDPLVEAVRVHVAGLRGSVRTVLVTDDTGRAEIREAVDLARRVTDHVVVFVTPTVLFEPGPLSDVDRAYRAFVDVEEFRRDLAGLERVSAFEVGPGERVDAVLARAAEPAAGRGGGPGR